MPLPSNFSNFGKSGGTAALTSRGENFASTPPPTPPSLKVTPPALRPPEPNTDFSNQNKNIPPQTDENGCEVECDSAGENCRCPDDTYGNPSENSGDDGSYDEQGYDRDRYDNPYDYGDNSISQADANAAAEQAKAEINDVIETSRDIGKYLSMADAAFSLANLGNALLNGIPLANQANSLNADANALKAGAFNLQSNLNSSINTLNQGIANRNMGQIQDGFNGIQAAQNQASQLQSQGQSIQQRANDLQGKAATYQRNTDMLQGASQAFGYGAQGANLFGQGYQAATQPNTENYTNLGASLAQTALKAAGDFTSFVSPIGAQLGSASIEAAKNVGISAGRGESATDTALGLGGFFGAPALSSIRQAKAAADAGDTITATEKSFHATFQVAKIGATASGVAAPFVMVGYPVAMGVTSGIAQLARGASVENATFTAFDVGGSESIYNKLSTASNTILQAKYGDTGYLSPDKPASALAQTIKAPLVTTQLTRQAPSYSSRSTGLYHNFNPSAAAELRDAQAYAQQVQGRVVTGGEISDTSYRIAASKAQPILDKYGIPLPKQYQLNSGIAPANFARE